MTGWPRVLACCWGFLGTALPVQSGPQDTVRVASFNTDLHRDGPGLLLRDILGETDPQVAAVVAVIAHTAPDILALQGIDWDHDTAALTALAARLRAAGVDYPHRLMLPTNSGMATMIDMDGDGLRGGAGDAQGYGLFTGQGGLAVLSRFAIRIDQVQDFSTLLWRDLPGALLPRGADGAPFPSEAALEIQRLSSTGHWVVPISLPGGEILTLLTYHAGPPVFDGPQDRNGRRNHDETAFWSAWLDGAFGTPPSGRFVLTGGSTLDPFDGQGRPSALQALLDDPRLQDSAPESPGAALAPDQGHRGANALDTVDWPGVGRFRVDYALPSRDWTIAAAGVFWPAPGEDGHDAALAASRHRLVWVDLRTD